jgi:hypothetical protein
MKKTNKKYNFWGESAFNLERRILKEGNANFNFFLDLMYSKKFNAKPKKIKNVRRKTRKSI